MSEELKVVINSLKAIAKENDGEVPYWGEVIREGGVSPFSTSPYEVKKGDTPPSLRSSPLDELRQNVIGDCHQCPLGDTRKKLVFGVGNPNSRVMFIGEGPGFEEDRQGEPFVGKAGQLLDKILSSIGLDRSKVYIANIVKCHPMVDPKNPDMRGNDRPPAPEEMQKCLPFLKKQIEIINPEVIVTLGATAAKTLLNTFQGITKIRGELREVAIIDGKPPFKVLPTYHPAALLRNPDLKKEVWQDMKLLRDLLSAEC